MTAGLKNEVTRKKKFSFSLDDLQLFFLSLPTTIWYIAFCYMPMFGIVIAFKNYKVLPGKSFLYSLFVNSKWVGLKNFRFLFRSPDTFLIFRNTIGYNIIFIILGVIIPVTLAICISQLYSKRLAKICQTSMFLPHFLSWVVVSYFVFAFLSTDKGLLNRVAVALGILEKPDYPWYQAKEFWAYFLVFLNQWKGVGYSMVVYLASISGIDAELYEAAVIDGASKTQQVAHITIPLLRPIISIMFILAVGNIFRSDFGLFYQASRNSGPLTNVTQTIDVYVYKALIEKSNINYASAASLAQSLFGMITIILANICVKKIDPEAGLF